MRLIILTLILVGCGTYRPTGLAEPKVESKPIPATSLNPEPIQTKPATIESIQTTLNAMLADRDSLRARIKATVKCNRKCVKEYPYHEDASIPFEETERGQCMELCPEYPDEAGGC